MESVDRAFFVLEKTRQVSRMTVSLLAEAPGWNRASASRYLRHLANAGWLENVKSPDKYPVYVLGPKLLKFVPDMRL